jgi:hypothetical protein
LFGGTVGWSDLIRRRYPRVKTTAVGVAAALAEAIVESTNVLQDRLGAEGFAWTDPARANSDDCLLECAIFEWFLRDVAMSDGFGKQTETIRRALAGRMLIDLQRSGVSTVCLEGFDARCRGRFAEYAEALNASASLQPLGDRAWRRISGRAASSERMTMLLAMRASGELVALRGLAGNFRLVELQAGPSPATDRE